MCGIIGIFAGRHVAADLYEGLIQLQHRGQDSAGMVTFDGHFHVAQGQGYVREALSEGSLRALEGSLGIAHTRYSTAGSASMPSNTQPFLTNTPYGIALVHNGNLTNYHELREELREQERIHCNSESDTEVLLGVLASKLGRADRSQRFFDTLSTAVARLFERVIGAYSVIGIVAGKGMFAFRDPHGIRLPTHQLAGLLWDRYSHPQRAHCSGPGRGDDSPTHRQRYPIVPEHRRLGGSHYPQRSALHRPALHAVSRRLVCNR